MSVARAAPASVVLDRSILLVMPKPKVWDVADGVVVVDDELVLDFAAALVMTPGAMPSRPSASELAGPAISVALTPELTEISRPSPPEAKLTLALPLPPSSALILVVSEFSVSPASMVIVAVREEAAV